MKTFGIILTISFALILFLEIKKQNDAREKKIKYSVSSLFELTDYTNAYEIDSLGCVHYYSEFDSCEVVTCGAFKIKVVH